MSLALLLVCTVWVSTPQDAQELLPAAQLPAALGGFDPVALTRGKEVPGKSNLSTTHLSYRYQFADAKNQALFDADPERYGIQMGGACARMGPLSGEGDAQRFEVHAERIFIFASDQCRDTFRLAPAKYAMVANKDPDPKHDAALSTQARVLLNSVAEAYGGDERIDGISSYHSRRDIFYDNSDGTKTKSIQGLMLMFGDDDASVAVRKYSSYQDWWRANVSRGENAFIAESTGTRPMHTQQNQYLRKLANHTVVAILKARNRADCAYVGLDNDSYLHRISMYFDDTRVIVGIDPTTDRILTIEYKGLGPRGSADITQVLSDYRDVAGVPLPHRIDLVADGKPLPRSRVQYDEVTLNVDVAPYFQRPKK